MKILTTRQWEQLEQANTRDGLSLKANMNTMASLYCRSLVKVHTYKSKSNVLRATPLGEQMLKARQTLLRTPDYSTSRVNLWGNRGGRT